LTTPSFNFYLDWSKKPNKISYVGYKERLPKVYREILLLIGLSEPSPPHMTDENVPCLS
jgi:hypothetical protein